MDLCLTPKLNSLWFLNCVQVWKAAPPSSLPAFCELGADWAAVLPQDHRKHSHGEAPVWHVQKLINPHWDLRRSFQNVSDWTENLLFPSVNISDNLHAVTFPLWFPCCFHVGSFWVLKSQISSSVYIIIRCWFVPEKIHFHHQLLVFCKDVTQICVCL